MLKNHLKIAWRSLRSNRLFTILNIVGLSLGLAITVLLYLFIVNELSFDNMYAKKDHIYRILLHPTDDDKNAIWPQVPPVTAPAVMTDIPGVSHAARLMKHGFGESANISIDKSVFIEDYFYWADNQVFPIFDIEIINGAKNNPIDEPNTVALSASTAKKYFGNEDPIGKTILIDNRAQLQVTAVYKDFPQNSTLDCNLLASFKSSGFVDYKGWDNASFETYLLAPENVSKNQLDRQLNDMLGKYVPKEDSWFYFSAQPLSEVHLYSANFDSSYTSRTGDIDETRNISFLAILILIIACINYVNLTTARSQKRSKDVGVNKTLGASSGSLIIRFYMETAIVTLISLCLGVLITILTVPVFNAITHQHLELQAMLYPQFLLGLVLMFLVTTLLAGSYPALYLSSFSPKSIFKPSFKGSKSIVLIRKGLIVFQFSASIILIVSALVIFNQVDFMKKKQLGFNPESVMAISINAVKDNYEKEVLADQFKRLGAVRSVAKVQGYPGLGVSGRTLRKDDNDQGINIQTNYVDPEIDDVLKLTLLSGRMPQRQHKGDSLTEVVLNKKAIDYLGYTPDEAIGKKVLANLGGNAYIVGVVDNFNFTSLKTPIGAYAMHNTPREYQSYLMVRFNTDDISKIVEQFKKTFEQTVPDTAFQYTFLDTTVKNLYKQEQKTANLSLFFCGLAIFVACLGLLGLAAFMAEQRTKEIGVRKVLGASVGNIATMLSKDFLILVFISILIAFPIAYYIMEIYLQGFAYRIKLHWYFFVISGIIAVVIALLTTSMQAVKAARSNPVKSLRTE